MVPCNQGIPVSYKGSNGTIGNTIGTNGKANGSIGSASVPLAYVGKPMIPLVKLPMVPLGEPRTRPVVKKRELIIITLGGLCSTV